MAEETAGHKGGESGGDARPAKKRRPYIQLFPADLRSDQALRLCSRAARSFWTDLFGLMHFSDPRGYLLVSGRPPTHAEIAKILGDTDAEVTAFVDELERNGVFSRTRANHELGAGVIYCRRMVREAEKAAQDAENGALGGNPDLRAVIDANASVALSAEEKRIAARERTRRYRQRKKAGRVTSPRDAGDATSDVTVTVDKRDCEEKKPARKSASASVTGVNPHLLSSNSISNSSSSESAGPELARAIAPNEQSRPPSPSIGGGRDTNDARESKNARRRAALDALDATRLTEGEGASS